MTAVTDSYSESNYSLDLYLSSSEKQGVGQSFAGDGSSLVKATFYMKKFGSPTGNMTANMYVHSGTFGTSSVPTGTALATSTAIDVSTLTASFALTDFTFDGSVQMANGTKYVITVEYSGGNLFNDLAVGVDSSSPTHGGNNANLVSGSWSAAAGVDVCFYVYGLTAISAQAAQKLLGQRDGRGRSGTLRRRR